VQLGDRLKTTGCPHAKHDVLGKGPNETDILAPNELKNAEHLTVGLGLQ